MPRSSMPIAHDPFFADDTAEDGVVEIFSPITMQGEPVCCGSAMKCVDPPSPRGVSDVVELFWWCEECNRHAVSEERVGTMPALDVFAGFARDDEDDEVDYAA